MLDSASGGGGGGGGDDSRAAAKEGLTNIEREIDLARTGKSGDGQASNNS